ncbi:MAG: hypothetical protein ABIO92_00130 [Chloroflexia bacterium]
MENRIEEASAVLPIACTLSEPEQAERGEEISTNIFSEVQQRIELEDGYEFLFSGTDAWAAKLLQFIITERDCCRFFTFELIFDPNLGPIRLRLRGPEGTKGFIESSF